MTPIQADLRKLVVQSLELLASNEAAFEYQRRVPIADVPAELFCWWFEDAYHPDSEIFQGAFTRQELRALATFNTVFGNASKAIGQQLPSLELLLAMPAWQPVSAGAKAALKAISGSAQQVAQRDVPASGRSAR